MLKSCSEATEPNLTSFTGVSSPVCSTCASDSVALHRIASTELPTCVVLQTERLMVYFPCVTLSKSDYISFGQIETPSNTYRGVTVSSVSLASGGSEYLVLIIRPPVFGNIIRDLRSRFRRFIFDGTLPLKGRTLSCGGSILTTENKAYLRTSHLLIQYAPLNVVVMSS